MSPRILILNNYSSANRGDAAILDGLITTINQSLDNPKITVLSSFPKILRKYHPYTSFESLINSDKVTQNNFYFYLLLMVYLTIWAVLNRYLKIQLPNFSKSQQLKLYKNSDLIISVGGGYINDNYKPGVVTRLFEFYFAKLLGKRVVLWGHSIGPFKGFNYRIFTNWVLNKVDIIATRDQRSNLELNKLGVKKPKILQTFDSAFALNTKRWKQGSLQRFAPSGRFISISVRYWPFHKNKYAVHRNYIMEMIKLCDWLIAEGFQLVFVSTTPLEHHIGDTGVAKEIICGLKDSSKAIVVDEIGYTYKDLINFYSKAFLNIGTRMHSTILASLAGTPSLAISYEFKSKGLFSVLELSEFVVEQQGFSYEELKPKVIKLIRDREKIKALLLLKCEFFSQVIQDDFEKRVVPLLT